MSLRKSTNKARLLKLKLIAIMNYCFKQELHKLLWFNDNDKDNINEMIFLKIEISFQLLVMLHLVLLHLVLLNLFLWLVILHLVILHVIRVSLKCHPIHPGIHKDPSIDAQQGCSQDFIKGGAQPIYLAHQTISPAHQMYCAHITGNLKCV